MGISEIEAEIYAKETIFVEVIDDYLFGSCYIDRQTNGMSFGTNPI